MLGTKRAIAVLTALLLGAAACSSSSSSSTSAPPQPTTTTTVIAAPAGLPAFYAVPQPLPTAPGTLIKSQRISVPALPANVYRVMYVSRSEQGKPVAVTGLIAVPKTPPPPGGYKVVTWGHGTDGMADKCAPSLTPSTAVPLAKTLIDNGWEIVASDYEGEGTPGLLPYVVGDDAARNTIDIVRAARHLSAAHASARYVVWGHSEGGQTAMFALHIGATYAPELQLEGVVAGAPPSQFQYIYNFLKSSPFKHYLLMAAGGYNAAYGDGRAPLDEVLTPYGKSLLPLLNQLCAGDLGVRLAPIAFAKATKTDPFTVPAWKTILLANDPESFTSATRAPLLIIQGGNDEQIPVASTQLLAQHLCGVGQDLERWVYPGQSHAGVIQPSTGDMVQWITNRFAGKPNPDPYAPAGEHGVQVTRCPDK
jgi:pimeloyl-ACP methyl ester carboxylesterase